MKLIIQLNEINYSDVAIKAIHSLNQRDRIHSGIAGKIMNVIAGLPEKVICEIIDAIPIDLKNEIIASVAMECKDEVLCAINKIATKQKIGVTLADYRMDHELELVAEIDQIDYLCIVERFLPAIRDKLMDLGGMAARLLRPVIQNASADQVMGLLDRFVSDQDTFFASLINKNQLKLIQSIEAAAEKQNIHIIISSIVVEV